MSPGEDGDSVSFDQRTEAKEVNVKDIYIYIYIYSILWLCDPQETSSNGL